MKERPEPEGEDTPTIPTHDSIVTQVWNDLASQEANAITLQRIEAGRAYDGPPVHFRIPRPLGQHRKFLTDDSGGPHPERFDVSAEGFDAPLEDTLVWALREPLEDIMWGAGESRKMRAAAYYLNQLLLDLWLGESQSIRLPTDLLCHLAFPLPSGAKSIAEKEIWADGHDAVVEFYAVMEEGLQIASSWIDQYGKDQMESKDLDEYPSDIVNGKAVTAQGWAIEIWNHVSSAASMPGAEKQTELPSGRFGLDPEVSALVTSEKYADTEEFDLFREGVDEDGIVQLTIPLSSVFGDAMMELTGLVYIFEPQPRIFRTKVAALQMYGMCFDESELRGLL